MSLPPICVVGMHRSGTSLTTRMLASTGVDLGPPSSFVPPDSRDNSEGYQEQAPIVNFNDELLRALGGHASEPPELAAGWERAPEIEPFAERAGELITGLYSASPWAFKDPRASLLLPFWSRVLPGLKVLICIRNPLEVALSMDRRGDPYAIEHWPRMWRRHTQAALTDSSDCAREIVIYEDLIDDPVGHAIRLGHFAQGMAPELASVAMGAALPDLDARRSAIDDFALMADSRVSSEIAQEYIDLREWVRRMNAGKSADHGSIDSRASNPITTQP